MACSTSPLPQGMVRVSLCRKLAPRLDRLLQHESLVGRLPGGLPVADRAGAGLPSPRDSAVVAQSHLQPSPLHGAVIGAEPDLLSPQSPRDRLRRCHLVQSNRRRELALGVLVRVFLSRDATEPPWSSNVLAAGLEGSH